MKFLANKKVLSEAIDKLTGVANGKSTLASTKHLLFVVDKANRLTIHATDLELFATVTIPCEVVEQGSLCLLAGRVASLVRGVETDTIEIKSGENNWANLRAGRSKARIAGMHADDFPSRPTIDMADKLVLDTALLQNMIGKTLYCVSTNEARPNLTGANLKFEDDELVMCSTDGTRLALMKQGDAVDAFAVPEALNGLGVIIPRKALIEINRAFDSRDDQYVDVVFSDDRVTLYASGLTLTSMLVEGSFPDYRQVLPRRSDDHALVDRKEFIDAVKYVSLTASKSTLQIHITLNEEGLHLYGSCAEFGEASRTIEAEYSGPEIKVGINYKLMLDALGAIDGDEITIELIDTLSPVIICDPTEPGLLCVVMPMRL